jgi:tetratricopeptide (TPR) repeat protein
MHTGHWMLKKKKIHRNLWLPLLALGAILLAAWFAALQVRQDSGIRELISIINRLPESEQLKPIACSRTPLTGSPEKAALQRMVSSLAQPAQRASVFCLLGDYSSALAAYELAAASGDNGSALQVYFLRVRQGDLAAAKQGLSRIHFSAKELLGFFTSTIDLNLNLDVLPVAQRMVELYPENRASWLLWLMAAGVYEHAADWPRALNAYQEALLVQKRSGVTIGHSSFESAAGRIYQNQLEPHDLNQALIYYNQAITDPDFLNYGANLSKVYFYRAEVYQGLKPTFSAAQALQDYLQSLELDPENVWTLRAIAGIYLWDLKNYSQAEKYINLAIGANPDLADNYLMSGDILRQQGNLNGAEAAYWKALAHNPGWQAALDQLAAVQAELKKQAP